MWSALGILNNSACPVRKEVNPILFELHNILKGFHDENAKGL